jgi:hypothetical protein
VVPTDQGLDAHESAVGDRDDRLVEEAQLVPPDRPPQLALELEAIEHAGANVLVEELVAVPPALLGPKHGGLRVADQPVAGALARLGQRDPDARGDAQLGPLEGQGGERRPNALGHANRVALALQALAQDDELVSAKVTEPNGRGGLGGSGRRRCSARLS